MNYRILDSGGTLTGRACRRTEDSATGVEESWIDMDDQEEIIYI